MSKKLNSQQAALNKTKRFGLKNKIDYINCPILTALNKINTLNVTDDLNPKRFNSLIVGHPFKINKKKG